MEYSNCPIITITPSLPLLDFEIESPMISLIEGESLTMKTIFQNSGNQTIDFIQLSVINLSKCKIKFNPDLIKNNVPLSCGNFFHLPIEIFGIRDDASLKDVSFKIKYKTGESSWFREVIIPIKVQIKPGVILHHCSVVDEFRNDTIICNLYNESDQSFSILSPSNEESFLPSKCSKNYRMNVNPFETMKPKDFASSFSWKTVIESHLIIKKTKDEIGKVVYKEFRHEEVPSKLFSHPQKIEKYFKSNLIVRDENNLEYTGNHLSISVDVGSSISVSQWIEKKNVKTISSFFVYQNSEEWKEIQATENEIFCHGKLSNTIPMVRILELIKIRKWKNLNLKLKFSFLFLEFTMSTQEIPMKTKKMYPSLIPFWLKLKINNRFVQLEHLLVHQSTLFKPTNKLNMGGKLKDMTDEQKGLHKQLRERLLKLELSDREKKDVMNDLTIWRFVYF
jgi:hypothetical protein